MKKALLSACSATGFALFAVSAYLVLFTPLYNILFAGIGVMGFIYAVYCIELARNVR